jgi:pimeloyl-ACP methyl ester carboxylesterase
LDAPISDRRQWKRLAAPVLVVANNHDVIHPFEYGVTLAREIPGAEFREVTSKRISVELHQEQTRRCLADFLRRHF